MIDGFQETVGETEETFLVKCTSGPSGWPEVTVPKLKHQTIERFSCTFIHLFMTKATRNSSL